MNEGRNPSVTLIGFALIGLVALTVAAILAVAIFDL